MEDRGLPAYIAEFLGTLLLVLFVGFVLSEYNTTVESTNQQGQVIYEALGYVDWTVIALLHFFVLAMLIATLGGTSGGHFNPAVTIVMTAMRKIKPPDAAIYIIVQLLGALAGAFICKLILEDEGKGVGYGSVGLSQLIEEKALAGFFVEMIGTFVLVWAIFGVAVNVRAPKGWAPFIIGGTLAFAVMVMGPLTGAGLNPARSFGPNIVASEDTVAIGDWLLAYGLGPIVGALLAGVLYTAIVLRPQEALAGGRLADSDVLPGHAEGAAAALEQTPGERPIDKLD